ncbi:MAG TPA: Ig-like domain-containing protein [Myxococcota bacterium]|nr:Ig-like domain-containing protein [Myxococcota bacterium]HRY96379.1 Ig-like domain-containing protein [Myxococcota bacterium]HSA20816.1 Ig-like domain-containing protein [Myxococcota bacterium]
MRTQHTILVLALLGASLLWAGPASAVQYDLRAAADSLTLPDGQVVPIWGFGLVGGPISLPGPRLVVPPGDDTLVVNLTNELSEPVSLVVFGHTGGLAPVRFLDAQGRERIRSFQVETAPGATGTYTFQPLRPGTYLYASGSHPAVQLPMGLVGAVTHDFAVGEAYPGLLYDNEALLVYSELDPALNAAVAAGDFGPAGAVTSTVDFKPSVFLVNGLPAPAATAALDHAPVAGERTLLRLVNAGQRSHVPTLVGHLLTIVAEDAFPLRFARPEVSPLLAAAKSLDALVVLEVGRWALYDRRLFLGSGLNGGMLVSLDVTAPAAAPLAVPDAYITRAGQLLSVAAPGVMANDAYPRQREVMAVDLSSPAHGTLAQSLDGSFTYRPEAGFQGLDSFSYMLSDGEQDSAPVRVDIQVGGLSAGPRSGLRPAPVVADGGRLARAGGLEPALRPTLAAAGTPGLEPSQARRLAVLRVSLSRLTSPQAFFLRLIDWLAHEVARGNPWSPVR